MLPRINISRALIVCLCIACVAPCSAQQPDTLVKKLDSLRKSNDTTGPQINNTARSAFTRSTDFTASSYFILLASNVKQGFTKPFHMKPKDWGNFAKFTLLEAALSFADKPVQRNVYDLVSRSNAIQSTSNYITRFGANYEVYTLLALAAESYIFSNEKLKTTTLLASQSYITAEALQFVLKRLSGRQRPFFLDKTTFSAEPRFHGPFYTLVDANGSHSTSAFPSGHTTAAFSAATVYSLEYKDKKWVPWLSYSVATLIGLSRLTENAHWLTDIIAGAGLGYLTGLQVVNNYHRYAKIKSGETTQLKKQSRWLFTINYNHGVAEAGFVKGF